MLVKGKMNRIRRAVNRAITPPNLFGIDRRMAYTHKKYHSGLIWIGVTNGLDIIKFSGSVSKVGINIIIIINSIKVVLAPTRSLKEKYI